MRLAAAVPATASLERAGAVEAAVGRGGGRRSRATNLSWGGAVAVVGEGAMVGEIRGMAGRGAADRRRRRLGQGGAARRRGARRSRVAAAGG